MKLITRAPLTFLLAGSMLAASLPSLASVKLAVGNKAPELKVAKWVKGTPVKSFEKGKVYVVEFWATWCGPCKTSIPHLTELAKKYEGKVSFTGVSVSERDKNNPADPYMDRVEAFVKTQGDKMNYNVAVDGTDDFMSTNWMRAAEQNGIPTAFVIDQNQKVAWIGHPMGELEEVLDQVIVGKFDAAGAARMREEAEKKNKEIQAEVEKVTTLIKGGKAKEACDLIDKLIRKNPSYAAGFSSMKFDVLIKSDEPAAYKYADQLGKTVFKDDPVMLNSLAWTIAEARPPVKNPDLDVALRLALRADQLTKHADATILDTLGYVYYKQKNLAKAVEIQELAVSLLPKSGLDASTQKELTDRLALYKKG